MRACFDGRLPHHSSASIIPPTQQRCVLCIDDGAVDRRCTAARAEGRGQHTSQALASFLFPAAPNKCGVGLRAVCGGVMHLAVERTAPMKPAMHPSQPPATDAIANGVIRPTRGRGMLHTVNHHTHSRQAGRRGRYWRRQRLLFVAAALRSAPRASALQGPPNAFDRGHPGINWLNYRSVDRSIN